MKKAIFICLVLLVLIGCSTTNISQIRDKWGPPTYTLNMQMGAVFVYHFPQRNKTALFSVNQTGEITQKQWAPGWALEAIRLAEDIGKNRGLLNKKSEEFEKTLSEKQKIDIQRCLLRKDCEIEEYLSDFQIGIVFESKKLQEKIEENMKIINGYMAQDERRQAQRREDIKWAALVGAIASRGNVHHHHYQFQPQWMPIH